MSQYIMLFHSNYHSTLWINFDRFTMTTWQQGGLLKYDSYFTGYQQPTELYAFISSRVTLKFSTHVWGRHDHKSWCYVAIGDEVKHDNLMSNEFIL